MKLVSVIVPCYNVEKTLERCLNSLMDQTLKDMEVIAVDDGSTDKTWEILNDYQKDFPEKIRIFHKENGGLGSARNYGLKEANSYYVGFVDSDDYVEEDMFEQLSSRIYADESDLVECNLVWEYPDHKREDIGRSFSSKEDFIANGRILVCNKLYKLSIIRDHNIKFPVGTRYEDIPFTLHYARYMKQYSYVDQIGYHYVQYENSLSNHQNEKVKDIFGVIRTTLSHFENASKKEDEALEYFCIRVLLGSSYKRICKIQDASLKKECINDTWFHLNELFPDWKKNTWLKQKGMKNFYFRHMNLFLLKSLSFLFRR